MKQTQVCKLYRNQARTLAIVASLFVLSACSIKTSLDENAATDSSVPLLPTPTPAPVVLAPKVFSQVTAGRAFTCGLDTGGDVYCFGERSYGVLGDGTINEVYTPSPILTTNMVNKNFQKVSVGVYGSCGIDLGGMPYCWGNSKSALGTGFTETVPIPIAVDTSGIAGQKTFIDISVNLDHACGITSDNLVYCWGSNAAGQLGAAVASAIPAPVNVSGLAVADRTFSQVVTGSQFTCGVTVTKKAYCWGKGTGGALGNNAAVNSSVPVAVNTTGITGSTNFASIFAATAHVCALMDDTAAYCWGSGSHGRLGNGGTTQKNLPTALSTGAITGGFTGFKSLSLADRHTCGITNLDTLYCWGNNFEGRIGDGTTNNALVPTAVNFGAATTVKFVAAATKSTCAQKMDNSIFCWGDGALGQLGNGVSIVNSLTPIAATATSSLPLNTLLALSSNDGFCARFSNGQAYCWGPSEFAQLGHTLSANGPVKVDTSNLGGTKKFKKINAGYYHVCGIGMDDKVYCWGYGFDGEMGTGVKANYTKPVAPDVSGLPAGITFSEVRGGGSHTCALASNSNLYCWGYNGDGELGINSTTESLVPVAVDTTDIPGNKVFISLDTGNYHNCGITQDFKAHCWGWGGDRALGNGNTANRLRPYPVSTAPIVSGSTSFSQISVGARASCATMSDGEAYCWGTGNVVSATAAGTTTSSPSKVSKANITTGSTTISSIVIGEAHGCLKTADNGLYCFGYNAVGQLCNGTFTNSNLPTNVTANFPAFTDLTVSRAHSTFIIGQDQKIYGAGWGLYGQLGAAIKRNSEVAVTPVTVY